MTFGLKITGTLDKPKVNTSATQEILSLPLQMLKRTMELPSQLKKATPVKKTLP
jgi:hypothetical protein